MAACKEQVSVCEYMSKLGAEAATAARVIANASTASKNAALRNMAERIISQSDFLAKENAKDLIAGKDKGLSDALLDRLELTSSRIEGMAEGLSQIAALPDPIGQIDNMAARESGIQVGKMRVPLGVIGIIYESRPNVTADAAGLCLKSGNATILRGGSEAIHSNRAIGVCVQQGLESAGLPKSVVQIVETTDREAVGLLLGMNEQVDMIIPRGGKSLIERVARDSRIPVLKHLDGVCHVYIDAHANPEQAVAIAVNAKTHRYGVCNAMETLLIHSQLAEQLLPIIEQRYAEYGVELRGCERTRAILPQIKTASEQDWYEEYLAPILAIRVVDDLDQAIHHIEKYGSHHTDAIVSEDYTKTQRFLKEVDSSSVMVNASTRFADGFEYGLGAEIGISTDKLHARGPVGLEGLTTQKYIVLGEGNLRE